MVVAVAELLVAAPSERSTSLPTLRRRSNGPFTRTSSLACLVSERTRNFCNSHGDYDWVSQSLLFGGAGLHLPAVNAGHDARHGAVVFGFGSKHGVAKRPGRRNGRNRLGGHLLRFSPTRLLSARRPARRKFVAPRPVAWPRRHPANGALSALPGQVARTRVFGVRMVA